MLDQLFAVVLFCFVTSFSPGPNNLMLMSSGVNFGVRASIPHLLGINIGFPLMLCAIGFGFGVVLTRHPLIYTLIKYCGAIYLLYLAWKISQSAAPGSAESKPKPFTFLQAALFQWVNPKAWVIAVGAIATYARIDSFNLDMFVIFTGFVIVGGSSMVAWLLIGTGLRRFLESRRTLLLFNYSMAGLLVISILPMLLAEL
jgi:threonine/homoserine/homoserine lactone efflux protein